MSREVPPRIGRSGDLCLEVPPSIMTGPSGGDVALAAGKNQADTRGEWMKAMLMTAPGGPELQGTDRPVPKARSDDLHKLIEDSHATGKVVLQID